MTIKRCFNIQSLKLFGNSWGNSYIRFLGIISCFPFHLLFYGYGFNFERRYLLSEQKSHLSPDGFWETFALDLIKQNVYNSYRCHTIVRTYTWSIPPPHVRICTHLDDSPSPSSAYILHWWPLFQPKSKKTFGYRNHWNIKIRKDEFL